MQETNSDHAVLKGVEEIASKGEIPLDIAALQQENAELRLRIAALERAHANDEKKLSIEQIVLRTLVEACPFRIFAKDLESRFIFGNSQLARAIGTGLENLMGKTDFDFFPEPMAAVYFSDEQNLFSTGESIIDKDEPTIDPETGELWWNLTSKVPLRDEEGKIFGLVGIGLNVTERKRLEQDLIKSNNELSELNRNLREAKEHLMQSERLAALGALVAGIAHELNTPIGNSLMLASLQQDNDRELSAALGKGLTRSQLEAYIARNSESDVILMRNLERAADLVSSFKQVAVDRTSANRRKFNLHETVTEIMLTEGPTLRKSTHNVEVNIPPEITLDSYPGPFGQVLTNLLNNALLHAFEGRQHGQIHISAVPAQELEQVSQVKFTVSDNGCGIDQAHLERVFDPFFTTKFGQGGSGLGLSIAYNLVKDILGGSIHVSSQPGHGTCFTLILPLVAPFFTAQPAPK